MTKAVKLGGKWWTVTQGTPGTGTWGDCDYDLRIITVEPHASPEMRLDTLLHEGLHACCPYLTDDVVEQTATELKDLLIAMGFGPLGGQDEAGMRDS